MMSTLPPTFEDALFTELDGPIPHIERVFDPIIRELIVYLNELPCLSDLQSIRKRSAKTSKEWGTAFNRINSLRTGHWYIFNWGGRNEMQFNIGMYSAQDGAYIRIGAGFNFERNMFGNPPKVAREFSSFVSNVIANRRTFENFFREQSLEVEFVPSVKVNAVVEWLHREAVKQPDEHDWVFIGRQLHRGKDRNILEDAGSLNEVIESVFSGFKPFF